MNSDTILKDSICAARQHHMRKINAEIYDGRDISRPWAYRLHDTLEKKHVDFVSFLMKPSDEFTSAIMRKEFLRKLSDNSMNSHASWFDKYLSSIPDTSSIKKDLSEKIGIEFDDIRAHLETILKEYKSALIDLFHWDHALSRKLNSVEETYKKIIDIDTFEDPPSASSIALQHALLDYIHHLYDSNNIEDYYNKFCNAYGRMMALRTVVMPVHAASAFTQKPICSICMLDEANTAFNPCGHVFCKDCAHKQQTQCYMCRATITDRLTLYFN